MLTIGEFSTVSRLTVKALRIYHDAGLLVPERIDPDNGYRYYGAEAQKRASAIRTLRDMDFTLKEMEEIFSRCREEEDLASFLARKLEETESELRRYGLVKEKLERLLAEEGEMGTADKDAVTERDEGERIICSIRYRGRYDEIGRHFARLYAAAGRYGARQPMALYHDGDYREGDADVEAAVTVTRAFTAPEGMVCRVLQGGRAVVAVHRGPYETLGESYAKLFGYCRDKGYRIKVPTRELYLKGPGMILPRNPKKFVTEISALIERD